jgi:hypothetical protein
MASTKCSNIMEFNADPESFTELCLDAPLTPTHLKLLLRKLPEATNLSTLRILTLDSKGVLALAPTIKSMPKLARFDLGKSDANGRVKRGDAPGDMCISWDRKGIHLEPPHEDPLGPDGENALALALSTFASGLHSITLVGNGKNVEVSKKLIAALTSVTTLQSLYIEMFPLGDGGVLSALAASLKAIGNLKNLYLPPLDSKGALALAPALNGMAKMERIDLGYIKLGLDADPRPMKQCIQALLSNIDKVASVTKLELGGEVPVLTLEADPKAAAAVAALLPSLGSLDWVKEADISLPFEGSGETLAAFIKAMPKVTSLYLGSCKLGVAGGAAAITPALKSLTDLRILGLIGNMLGEEGAAALTPALSALAAGLEKLYLSRNDLGNDGAAILASTLKKMVRLDELFIENNNIGEEGFAALAPALTALHIKTIFICLGNDTDGPIIRSMLDKMRESLKTLE